MMTLHDLQNDFISILTRNNEFASSLMKIHENNLMAKQRLQIYRNNFFNNLTESLKNVYPMILRLVGEDFFIATAKEFISTTLPTHGNLNMFGEGFSDFLANFSATQMMSYLAEVAHFEWACHQAYYAANYLPLDLKQLKTVPPENYGKIKFKLHPSHQLLAYSSPVLSIWQMCQEPEKADTCIDLSIGGQKILVIRPQLQVNMQILTAGEFTLLSAFSNGTTFTEACTLALAAQSEFSIDLCLQKHLLDKHIVGFSVNDEHY